MQTEDHELAFAPTSEHITHDISLSSYADALFLAVCLAIAMFARFKKRILSASFVATGFAILLLKYSLSHFIVSFQSLHNSYPSLTFLSMWLGPVGLCCLAIGIHKSYNAPVGGRSLEQ